MEYDDKIILSNCDLMIFRRGYTEQLSIDREKRTYRNPQTNLVVTLFLIFKEKTNNKKIIQFLNQLRDSNWEKIILIHEYSLTTDAKKIIEENLCFETFTFDEMSYDPIASLVEPYDLYTGPPIKEVNNLPKIQDIITRYYAFKPGSVLQIKDFKTKIPRLYLVIKV